MSLSREPVESAPIRPVIAADPIAVVQIAEERRPRRVAPRASLGRCGLDQLLNILRNLDKNLCPIRCSAPSLPRCPTLRPAAPLPTRPDGARPAHVPCHNKAVCSNALMQRAPG